ncbi:hypothetical protein [Peptoniphilus vaginalis]|uniref:hypothetical protein n=1 Tax=Peptoniphilus vaginalis TaxID=1756987 RepID=UPI0023F70F23|nr:hypothetical protein [Peptoniphilus vaginalis]
MLTASLACCILAKDTTSSHFNKLEHLINSLLKNEVGVLYKVIEPYDLIKKCEIVVPYEVIENDNFTN